MGTIGNTFDASTFKVGHSRKVFREIVAAYPGGATISNMSDWSGKIPSGRPCKFDPEAKTAKVYTTAQVKAATTPEAKAALGINGYIQEDVVIKDGKTIGTATVLYDAEIYQFMYDSAEVAILKALTSTPKITWVY